VKAIAKKDAFIYFKRKYFNIVHQFSHGIFSIEGFAGLCKTTSQSKFHLTLAVA